MSVFMSIITTALYVMALGNMLFGLFEALTGGDSLAVIRPTVTATMCIVVAMSIRGGERR